MEPNVVDNLVAQPGERATGLVPVDLGPRTVEVPVVIVNGSQPGPRVGVTAGIHGSEYVSIAALRRVALALDPVEVTGSLVAALVSNPPAFAARSIYVNPLDGKNLNRAFPGDAQGTPTERLAAWLHSRIIEGSDRFVDMHCGDMNEALISFAGYEETGNPEVDDVARRMAEAYGLDFMVVGPLVGSTTTAAASLGIPAVLGEVGGQGLWPESDVELHAAGFRRALHVAGLIAEPEAGPRRESRLLTKEAWLRSDVDGMFVPTVNVGAEVTAGEPLGEVQDAFGRTLKVVEAPIDGFVIFLVSSLAMNTGDPLLAVAG